ncbi:uncharacterized protein [Euwallacea fornicatus]|uniref:uncharacterized protein isoform X1 n=1 Tax=Euwallacea fornicatus TaxID=995702 RepID=UPI00338F2C58
MAEPIVNPELPFVGEVPAGLQPGKMLRFQGITHPNSDRFNINLATGPNSKPRDDTALHLSVRLNQGYIARNIYKAGAWGNEEGSGKLPIGQAESFEIIILTDPHHYKVAVNGQHFCEFRHQIPYQEVTHLLVDGDVTLTLISFEGIIIPGNETSTQASQVNAAGPQFGGPQYGPPPGTYGPPPSNYGGYGPPPPPGAEPQSELGGFFDKAQEILAGAIATGAAEKILGSILHSSGQPNQQPQGYAPQNARYGIYPDLPTQDTTPLPTQNKSNPSSQDSALSNLIAGSGGTVITGPQPTLPPEEALSTDHGAGPFQNILMGLLSGGGGQNTGGQGQSQNTSSGGSEMLSGILSSLLSGGGQQSGGLGGQHQPPSSGQAPSQGGQGQSVDFMGILSGLLSSNQNTQNSNHPSGPSSAQTQGQSSDVISGILSSLLSPNQNQSQNPTQSPPPPQFATQPSPTQHQSGDILNVLQGLISGSNQQQPAGSATTQNIPPQNYNQPPGGGQPAGLNVEALAGLLQGLLSKAKEQHDSTRPIQETNPSGGLPSPSSNPPQSDPQQYGQYPHPPQQEQRGPVESLLSGLLSGGHQQQQPHPPQLGGDGSIGGLGSMGGILGSLAGSLLHRQDPH